MDTDTHKIIDDKIKKALVNFSKGSGFTARKLTDTPTDKNQVVPRGFVTNNGATANRPSNPVTGQSFFDTQIGKPIWRNGSNWVDATGSIV